MRGLKQFCLMFFKGVFSCTLVSVLCGFIFIVSLPFLLFDFLIGASDLDDQSTIF